MDWEKVVAEIRSILAKKGFEIHLFKIGWYNEHVRPEFVLQYDYDTLAVCVISTPDMFDKALKPFLLARECTGERDPLDKCVEEQYKHIKQIFPDHDIEVIHDFELHPNRRPKVLVQTVGHVSGAAYYYQRKDVQPDPWSEKQKIFGLSVHPKYGGWFAFRGILIFRDVKCADLVQKDPVDVVNTFELRKEMLERFNFHWQDWTYRDIIPVEKRYCQDQKDYFATAPKDRKQIVEKILKHITQCAENKQEHICVTEFNENQNS